MGVKNKTATLLYAFYVHFPSLLFFDKASMAWELLHTVTIFSTYNPLFVLSSLAFLVGLLMMSCSCAKILWSIARWFYTSRWGPVIGTLVPLVAAILYAPPSLREMMDTVMENLRRAVSLDSA